MRPLWHAAFPGHGQVRRPFRGRPTLPCGSFIATIPGATCHAALTGINCGSCGKTCSGAYVCYNGDCVDMTQNNERCGSSDIVCRDGQICCNGRCVDNRADNDNCGSCGTEHPLYAQYGTEGTCDTGGPPLQP